MRRFQFNLEKILELRRYHERQCELRLGEATGRCNALHCQIQERSVRKKNVFAKRGAMGRDISSFLSVEYYTLRMDREIEGLQRELEQAEAERRERQIEFLEASKKRKILDKLKDRKQSLYYREQLKTEQKALDDISSSMYIRRLEGVQ
ncbi:MAG: flagellar export protein FliJ [Spirochaetota bacterium]|nr:flagellar export protein FliJ [Spirochaetota bacterium]